MVKFPATLRGKVLLTLSIILLAAGFASLSHADAVAGNIHSYLSVISIVFGYLAFISAFFA